MTAELDARVAATVAQLKDELTELSGGRHIRLVAVTKGFGAAEVAAAMRAGVDGCGENYAQEMLGKVDELDAIGDADRVAWHFIGRLQRNKVKQLAPHVAVWQSVDRIELGAEIARRAPGAKVFAQVNISGEPEKGGCNPSGVRKLVTELGDLGLQVQGLMGVAAETNSGEVRLQFATLAALADDLRLEQCSMGMSGDYREAIKAGATTVRLGTALFGHRQ